MNTNEKENLRYKAYNEIKDRILMFELKPGEKIFEKDLVEDLKISRTPVREALLLLEKDRLVECDNRLGFMVRRIQPKEINEFFQIREMLEIYAAPLILDRITPEEINALNKNINQASVSLERSEYRKVVRLLMEFHDILWRSVKSKLFYQVISGLSNMFIWFRALTARNYEETKGSLATHRNMLNAIEQQDLKLFKSLIKHHLQHAKESNKLTHSLLL